MSCRTHRRRQRAARQTQQQARVWLNQSKPCVLVPCESVGNLRVAEGLPARPTRCPTERTDAGNTIQASDATAHAPNRVPAPHPTPRRGAIMTNARRAIKARRANQRSFFRIFKWGSHFFGCKISFFSFLRESPEGQLRQTTVQILNIYFSPLLFFSTFFSLPL